MGPGNGGHEDISAIEVLLAEAAHLVTTPIVQQPPNNQAASAILQLAQKEAEFEQEDDAVDKAGRPLDDMRNTHHDTNTFEVPKLGTAVPFNIWKMNLFAKLSSQKLLGIVTGSDQLQDDWTARKKGCWYARKKNAQLTILGAMTIETQIRFEQACWTADPKQLFDTIEREYTRVREQNTVFLRADMYNRRLRRNEPVLDYINDLMRRRNSIVGDQNRMTDADMVGVLLSNVVEVYPGIVEQYDKDRAAGKSPALGEAINILTHEEDRTARVQEAQRSGGNNTHHGRGMQPAQVNHVGHKRDRSRDRDGGRSVSIQRGSNYNSSRTNMRGGRGRSSSSSAQSLQRNDERKKTTRCHNCNKLGHWAREYRQPKRQSQFEPARGGDASRADRRNNNSTYGPSLVNMVVCADRAGASDETHIEWALDCGSQVNMCGDLSLFVELSFANGTTERTSVWGDVQMNVWNEHTQQRERRVLNEVYYSSNAAINLISLDYMQT